MSFLHQGAANALRLASLDGRLFRAPGPLLFGARRVLRTLASSFYAPPPDPSDTLRPARAGQAAGYFAQVRVIIAEANRMLESAGPVRSGQILAIAPLTLNGPVPVTASEVMAVILSPGVPGVWREQRVASQAIGDIVMAAQRTAQAARRDRPAHRVYVLVYESGVPDLVALNLEACRRPAEAVQEARERVQLIDALRRRFSVETVAHAALLGGEPSLILDSQLAAEPRRRAFLGEEKAAA